MLSVATVRLIRAPVCGDAGSCCRVGLQALYWVREPARKTMLIRWSKAYSRALLCHVRADAEMQSALTGVLLPNEIEAMCNFGNHGAAAFALQVGIIAAKEWVRC